jgi:hypothetical protein
MSRFLTLRTEELELVLEPGRGADVRHLTHLASGVDAFAATPWATHADAIRSGDHAPTTSDATARPLEQYAGGWQVLCPNAGPARTVMGAPVSFHGEAWLAPWDVVEADTDHATLRTELFSLPIALERDIRVQGTEATVVDTLTNLSDVELTDVDYVSHPTLGGAFLDGACSIDTGARTFTTDPNTSADLAPGGTRVAWPWIEAADGTRFDLRVVPRPGDRHMLFGWLSDFTQHRAVVTNHDLGLTLEINWDGTRMPYAWFWQEFNYTAEFPWYRRARTMAIEPSSTRTSGPERRSALDLAPGETVRMAVAVRFGNALERASWLTVPQELSSTLRISR